VTDKPALVFIYGPPAAGKLTVARTLAERTGYKLFHNHATFDMLAEIFPSFPPPFWEVLARVRLDVYETALRGGVNLITTMVYAQPQDDPFMNEVRAVCERTGASLCLAQLIPETPELERRVAEHSRAAFRKVSDIETLRAILAKWDSHALVTADDLSIDNTSMPPNAVADIIVEHFGL
jgi:hypothetical protein